MSLNNIKALVTSKTARQVLLARKHSPRVLFAAGTVGVVAATVLACRGTLKLEDVLQDVEESTDKAKALHAQVDGSAYSDQDLRQDLIKIRTRAALDIAKLYAPAIAVGAVSIAALTGSHVVLTKRNGAAMAAYAGLDRAYKEYRQRVTDEYGADTDRKFASGAENVLVEEKLSDGSTKTTASSKVVKGKSGASPYAVVFDEKSRFFTREPGMNAITVSMKQQYANDKLRANGHLFLNEVYDMLDVPRTKAGAVVGWVWRRETEEKTGDNYVDFGVFSGDQEIAEAFIDGDEAAVWLDFNVDGIILDLI